MYISTYIHTYIHAYHMYMIVYKSVSPKICKKYGWIPLGRGHQEVRRHHPADAQRNAQRTPQQICWLGPAAAWEVRHSWWVYAQMIFFWGIISMILSCLLFVLNSRLIWTTFIFTYAFYLCVQYICLTYLYVFISSFSISRESTLQLLHKAMLDCHQTMQHITYHMGKHVLHVRRNATKLL